MFHCRLLNDHLSCFYASENRTDWIRGNVNETMKSLIPKALGHIGTRMQKRSSTHSE
jgi:hypothetical protein